MEIKEIKSRCNNLLKALDKRAFKSDDIEDNIDFTEFNAILLVYRYDRELPIWKEMYRLYVIMHQFPLPKEVKEHSNDLLLQFRNCFSIFLSYLDDEKNAKTE